MKYLALGLFAASLHSLQAASLADHRWKHRLLVVPTITAEFQEELKNHRSALDERAIQVVALNAEENRAIAQEIAARFQLTADKDEVLLIGKDGRTTVRWAETEFRWSLLFERIDAMPMRQVEIRRTNAD